VIPMGSGSGGRWSSDGQEAEHNRRSRVLFVNVQTRTGGYMKIIGSRLLITIQYRDYFAYIWIAIINRDPNKGSFCKV
jgi:hypothetical protein